MHIKIGKQTFNVSIENLPNTTLKVKVLRHSNGKVTMKFNTVGLCKGQSLLVAIWSKDCIEYMPISVGPKTQILAYGRVTQQSSQQSVEKFIEAYAITYDFREMREYEILKIAGIIKTAGFESLSEQNIEPVAVKASRKNNEINEGFFNYILSLLNK